MESEQRYFLLPGEIAFATEKSTLSTLLGSCVSVCLYDQRLKIGGMNHYMLPGKTDVRMKLSPGKYGDYAIGRLIEMAESAGCKRADLVASVYGGGKVAGHLGSLADLGLYNIGERNVELAMNRLKELDIRILRHDTGEQVARKIHMDTATNGILLSRIERSEENIERARKLETFRKRKIHVLVVDDSRLVRKILKTGINSSDDMEVIAEAADPFEAREQILIENPDVICLDIIMPRMDGLTFLRKLMRYKYIPTVVVSTMVKEGSEMLENALEAGAFAAVDKDALSIYQGLERMQRELLPKLRQAAATAGKAAPR